MNFKYDAFKNGLDLDHVEFLPCWELIISAYHQQDLQMDMRIPPHIDGIAIREAIGLVNHVTRAPRRGCQRLSEIPRSVEHVACVGSVPGIRGTYTPDLHDPLRDQ